MNKNMSLITLLLVLLSVLFFIIAGCEKTHLLRGDGEARLEVVTTIFPLADMANRLGGEKITVTCLLPAGASPHTAEPTADQVRRCSRAGILLYIGRGLDDWAIKIAGAASGDLIICSLAEAALRQGWSPSQEPFPEIQSGGPFNPHLWLDPLIVRDYICPAITETLVEADGLNEPFYRANSAAYRQELTALDLDIRASLSGLPGKRFVSLHEAWYYFAHRYELDQAAVISGFPGQEPSAAWISDLVDLCRRNSLKVVAAEPQLSTALAETIAQETGGTVVLLDPLGGEGVPQRDSYLDLMRYNTAVLRDAFNES